MANEIPNTVPDSQVCFAARGSQRWLQFAIARRPELLDKALTAAGAIYEDDSVQWRSPLATDRFAEYRDGAALRLLGIANLPVRRLSEFWPPRGPVWDALGVSKRGQLIFVEAKAHIGEAASPACVASPEPLALIERSLNEARRYYACRATAVWTGRLYQYANRLAFHYFLGRVNGLSTRLVFLHFYKASDVRSPQTVDEWRGANELIHSLLGVPSDLSNKGVFHAYVDASSLA